MLPLCVACGKHHWLGQACHEADNIADQPISEFSKDLIKGEQFTFVFLAAYEKAFPGVMGMVFLQDRYNQQRGCDRLLTYGDGRQLYIEEKAEGVHNDFVLEFESNDVFHTKGWIEKELECDYLAYFIVQRCELYIFPWQSLFKAWKKYGEEWKSKFEWVNPHNRRGGIDSRTHCIVVPRHILLAVAPAYHLYRYAEGGICNP